jgi:hypothetical protein
MRYWLVLMQIIHQGWLGQFVLFDVVDSWNQLAKAFNEEFGLKIKAGQFMRYYHDGTEYSQVQLKIDKPTLAATPGTSNHGWGLAVDIDLTPGPGWYSTEMNTAQKFASAYYVWLTKTQRIMDGITRLGRDKMVANPNPGIGNILMLIRLIYPR